MKRTALFPLIAVIGLAACQDVTQPLEIDTLEGPAFGIVSVPSGIVSWWPGDRHANDIVGSNHGTLQGGATFAAGKVKQAFSLDGVDGFVTIPDAANLDLTTAITIDSWIKRASTGTIIVAAKRLPLNTGYGLRVLPDGRLSGTVFGKFGHDAGLIPTGVFTHVAWTYDKNATAPQSKLYINGVLVSTKDNTASISTNNAPLQIGRLVHAAAFFGGLQFGTGTVDELELFNRALSAAEIHAIFDAGKAGKRKPQVCVSHKGRTIRIAALALQSHLAHGDVQVVCPS